MRKLVSLVAILILSMSSAQAQQEADKPQVTIHTNHGDIRIELYAKEAPASVENFLQSYCRLC